MGGKKVMLKLRILKFSIVLITVLLSAGFLISCVNLKNTTAVRETEQVAQSEPEQQTAVEEGTTTETKAPPETTAAIETETTETIEETLETIQNGEVTILTDDEIELNGNVFGQGTKWVVLAPPDIIPQIGWFKFAEILADNGYVAVTFDYRGFLFENSDKDIEAAISYTRQHNCDKLFLIGAGRSGTESIIVSNRQDDISGVVTLTSPAKAGNYDALSIVPNLNIPKLFIATADSGYVEDANQLYEAAAEPKQIEIIENSSQLDIGCFDHEPENALILTNIMLDFLDNN